MFVCVCVHKAGTVFFYGRIQKPLQATSTGFTYRACDAVLLWKQPDDGHDATRHKAGGEVRYWLATRCTSFVEHGARDTTCAEETTQTGVCKMAMVRVERWPGMDGHDGTTAGKMRWRGQRCTCTVHSTRKERSCCTGDGRQRGSSHSALASWAGGVRQSSCVVINDGVLVSIRTQGVSLSCISIVLLCPLFSPSRPVPRLLQTTPLSLDMVLL